MHDGDVRANHYVGWFPDGYRFYPHPDRFDFLFLGKVMRPLTATETRLFKYLKKHYGLKNSVQLAEFLGVSPAALSKIRHGVKPYTAEFVLAVYDATGMSIEDIRALMKD